MRKLYILLLLFLAVFAGHAFAQQHTVKQKPVKKPSAKKEIKKQEEDNTEAEPEDTVKVTFGRDLVDLRTLDGWIKDDRDKWVHSPNRIPFENPDYNNQLYTKYKIGYENIRQINIVEIKIDSTPYLAFIIEQDKGFYKDSGNEDFKYYVAADYYLIKASDFITLWNDTLKINQPYEATMKADYSGLVGYKDLKLRPKYMAMEINKDVRNRKFTDTSVKVYLQFGMKPVQNKKGKFMRFYYGLAYARTGEHVSDFDFDIFSKRFYQTDLELFHRFSRPKSLKNLKAENKKEQVKKTEMEKEPVPEKDNDNIVD
jgi:hypothetical protein